MNSFRYVLALFVIISSADATQLVLTTAKQPLWIKDADYDVEIKIVDVPVAYSGASWDSTLGAITIPFTPPTDGSWKKPHNANLASVYGITITLRPPVKRGAPETVVIDGSKAKKPKDYPFSNEQVISAVTKCVELMVSPAGPEDRLRFLIEVIGSDNKRVGPFAPNARAEQGGADQPATDTESKPEGKKKPKPESKVRPQ